jgi:hypothetical protein
MKNLNIIIIFSMISMSFMVIFFMYQKKQTEKLYEAVKTGGGTGAGTETETGTGTGLIALIMSIFDKEDEPEPEPEPEPDPEYSVNI